MKTVLITGAASTLGKALAFKYRDEGYNLLLTYNNKEIDYLDEIDNYEVYKCNLKDEDSIKELYECVKDEEIDILINLACLCMDNSIENKTKKEFMDVLEVNVVGTFLITKYLLPLIKKDVIFISSLDSTKTPTKDGVDYIASKAAINTFAKTFSLSYPDIRFISLLFPWIDTSSIRKMNPEYLKEEMNRYGQTKLLTPEYVSNYIYDVTNSNIETGSIIEVDYD